jgi:23S rRNA (cytidine2498-2'-O)-methyltransferase
VRVDWLLCDVIAAPQRSIDLLVAWLQEERMVNFIVSIKFMGVEDYPLIDQLKVRAAPLCSELSLIRLSANKNEICAFGSAI